MIAAQELARRFMERNALQGPMEGEMKAATSLAVSPRPPASLHLLLLLFVCLCC